MTTTLKLDMLTTDWIMIALFILVIFYGIYAHHKRHLRTAWRYVFSRPMGMVAMIILSGYIIIGFLDCIHFDAITKNKQGTHMGSQVVSVLDIIVNPLGQHHEKTYSAPFATSLYNQSDAARLKYGGQYLTNPALQKTQDITTRALIGLACGLGSFIILWLLALCYARLRHHVSFGTLIYRFFSGKTALAWRSATLTIAIIWIVLWITAMLATHYHILGTDKVGRDVLYESINSIRTGLVIGTLATLFMLPFALILGMMAGYFQGFTDDVIQYIYTTLSSIPGVLLISASILVLQVYIANHSTLFPTLRDRADARLLALCIILGITSWATLCRLLRGETLKIRKLNYVDAARAMGVRSYHILFRHIMPNVMHIVLITIVLDFSNLVLAEAVLSYVGVGVDPTTISWGNMINASRLELAREPVVWWPLASALVLMFVLILAANLFSDTLRDAFDPKVSE